MNKETMLFRQVFPDWAKEGRISTQVFNPSAAHSFVLSSYADENFTAKSSFEHYTEDLRLQSAGSLGVTNEEYNAHDLEPIKDNNPFAGHVSIDYSKCSNGQRAAKAKILRNIAVQRGWLYQKLPEEDNNLETEENVIT